MLMHVYNCRYNIYNFEPHAHTCMHLLNTHTHSHSHILLKTHIYSHAYTHVHTATFHTQTNTHIHVRAYARTLSLTHYVGCINATACTLFYIHI